MFFLKKDTAKKMDTESSVSPIEKLTTFFDTLKNNEDFPFTMAVDLFQKLDSAATSEEQLMLFCLEDIIFSSLYATIYEELLITCDQNRDKATALVDKFLENSSDRDQKIAEQAQLHMEFIENGGVCGGCCCCANHSDVEDLLPLFEGRDLNFFIKLYIGMLTIQCTLEQLAFDEVPRDISLIENVSRDDILKFREHIYNFAEKQLA